MKMKKTVSGKYPLIHEFRDDLIHCSRCGFCQVACPVYGVTLRPALNPRGKMLLLKDLLDGRLALSEELVEAFYQCTGCGNCALNCPAGIKVPEMIKAARRGLVQEGFSHPAFRELPQFLTRNSNIYGEEAGLSFSRGKKNQKAKIVYFVGCVGSCREGESTQQSLTLLDRLQVDYTLIDEVCCSGVLEEIGFEIDSRKADYNIRSILETGAETVITECPFCFRAFTNRPGYGRLKEAQIQVLPLVRFLKDFNFGVTTTKRVTYHDPCDLGRHSGIYEEPRRIIEKIAPDFVEMPHNRGEALCCGAGGGMRSAYPGTSIAMAGRRLNEVEQVQAEVLLTNCSSCLHNFANAQKRYSHLRKYTLDIYNLSHFINLLLDQAGHLKE